MLARGFETSTYCRVQVGLHRGQELAQTVLHGEATRPKKALALGQALLSSGEQS